ncbi:MAG: hypothetical protein ACRDI1_09360 [Actinomycetota bacterium]
MKKLISMFKSYRDDNERRVRTGRLVGLAFIAVGFAVIGKAWDGAASINFVQGQIPYLLSGGFVGVGLIVTGSTLLLLTTVRAERRALHDKFDEMATLLGRNLSRMSVGSNGSGPSEQVVAGGGVYHRAGCKVLEGKEDLSMVTLDQAAAERLTPCRACDPPVKREAAASAS